MKRFWIFLPAVIITIICCSNLLVVLENRIFGIMAQAQICSTKLDRLGKLLFSCSNCTDYKLKESVSELNSNPMVSDLIQEMVRKGLLDYNDICCSKSSHPYYIFPVSIDSLILNERSNRVPILMDAPDSHRENPLLMGISYLWHWNWGKYACSVRVLYSDGSVADLSKEEAERLISEQSCLHL